VKRRLKLISCKHSSLKAKNGSNHTFTPTTAAGGAIGAAAGSLLGGLVGMGIPEEQANVYNNRVSGGDYLVMVDGTDAEINRAEAILSHRGIQEWGVYDIPGSQPSAISPTVTPPVVAPVLAPSVMVDDDEAIKLYAERLVVDKDREKTGEVAIGKHIEVETAQVSVPIERERVVIERVLMSDTTAAPVGTDVFHEGNAIQMSVYEETADIHTEAFMREEVSFRKEVSRENIIADETLRHEELDVDTQGHPVVNDRT
jgi:uncharacterized protein (TIGR02271 family)